MDNGGTSSDDSGNVDMNTVATESLEMRGALEGLKVLEVADFDRYRDALAAAQPLGWSYYFPFLLTQNRPGRSALLLNNDEGSVCLYHWRIRDSVPRLDIHSAPLPMNVAVLERCFERVNGFNGDRTASCRRIDAKDVKAVASLPWLRVKEKKLQYLFAPANYVDLAGKKFYTVRRNVQQVENLQDVQVRPFERSDAGPCHDLLRQWRTAHRATHGGAGGFGMSRRAIDLVGALPANVIRGEVVLVDGRLSAFAFGGELRPGLGCSFDRKCDTEIRGMSFFQFRSLLLSLGEFELVNDGSDTGRAGLRQLKDTFRPVDMHTEHMAIQQR